ncbi:hypothetical protein BZA05DRAFT_109428 [Tricharina praecox]|uniref:uncharacterized protein n=1 Tax=Tricharina praecox TaxID=43433 RepID=UPI00221FAAF5|nr:uncharacterized protein BZA05DRAFT_109428 [Tricharina praecox]KAI5857904.1 hypothetical protein BZA05DRAFT_109428 [Tricharina praecox]
MYIISHRTAPDQTIPGPSSPRAPQRSAHRLGLSPRVYIHRQVGRSVRVTEVRCRRSRVCTYRRRRENLQSNRALPPRRRAIIHHHPRSLARYASASNVQCPMSNVQCPVSSVQCPVSSVQCPVSSVQCPNAIGTTYR